MTSFIKVITLYPIETVREKNEEFKGPSMILSVLLAIYLIAVSAGYYKVGLSEYVMGWEGKVISVGVDTARPGQTEIPKTMVMVEKQSGGKEVVSYTIGTQQSVSVKKDTAVRKPFFYSEPLFGSEGISFSVVLSDVLFFIMGFLIFLFALICGSSFITIIFSSVFMVRSKYAKNKK